MRNQTRNILILIIISIISFSTYFFFNKSNQNLYSTNQETEIRTEPQIEDTTVENKTKTNEDSITEPEDDELTQKEDSSNTDHDIELPIRLRIVTSSDWSTFTFNNGKWGTHHITAGEFAGEAFGDENVISLTQSLQRAKQSKTVEMYVNTSVKFPQILENSEENPKLSFTIQSGDIGWTHIEVSNIQNKTASIVDNYWLSDDTKSRKTIQVPLSYLNRELKYNPALKVDASSLQNKALLGYQGWFGCPDDGSDWDKWLHWFYDNIPDIDHLTVDFWPDMTEYEVDQRYPTDMVLQDGSPAELFSSYDLKTVTLHFDWMEEYGLDGAVFQRFVVGLYDDPTVFGQRNKVLQNVRIASERHGRVFLVQYDFSGLNNNLEDVKQDWVFLVDNLKITDSPNYIYHNSKPVIGLWGIGFKHINLEPDVVNEFLQWIQYDAPERYRATILGGVPTWWRILEGDSHSDPDWRGVYDRLDVICPWTVGRYHDKKSADGHLEQAIKPDIRYTSRIGKEYMTVIWPGFSWHNLFSDYELDFIPRDNGEFIWRQAYNIISAGSDMVFIAMFDEVDEGTAMFKIATRNQLPVKASLVSVNVQDPSLPSDYYLIIGNQITQMLHGEISLTRSMP